MEYWDKSLLEGGETGGRCLSTRASSALCCRRFRLELRSRPNVCVILLWSETL